MSSGLFGGLAEALFEPRDRTPIGLDARLLESDLEIRESRRSELEVALSTLDEIVERPASPRKLLCRLDPPRGSGPKHT